MTIQEQAQLERLGFQRTNAGPGLHGDRLWWKRVDNEIHIVRQVDGATKHQELPRDHPGLPSIEDAAGNRQWAVALADDDLADWHGGIEDALNLCCDRCGATAEGEPATLVDDIYLIDDPSTAVGHLCPACASDDDPHHIAGSWLLTWSA